MDPTYTDEAEAYRKEGRRQAARPVDKLCLGGGAVETSGFVAAVAPA